MKNLYADLELWNAGACCSGGGGGVRVQAADLGAHQLRISPELRVRARQERHLHQGGKIC